MLNAACHCGAVHAEIDQRPTFVNECDFSPCRKAGAALGYFDPAQVRASGETRTYGRADRETPSVEIHFFPHCDVVTHWTLTAAFRAAHAVEDRMEANMRLFDEADLAGVQWRYPDGLASDRVSDHAYRKPPIILGDN
ncbi:MAG: aldehyde-activating protein [Pseudomonadota bacterium]